MAEWIHRLCPEVVLSSNTPLDTKKQIHKAAKRAGADFIFWVQDLYSKAMLKILSAKFGRLGTVVGRLYRRLERRMLNASDDVIVISPWFGMAVRQLTGIDQARIT